MSYLGRQWDVAFVLPDTAQLNPESASRGPHPPHTRRARRAVPRSTLRGGENPVGLALSPPCRNAIPGPASLRPANGAAAEIAGSLPLPPAAGASNSSGFSTAAEKASSLYPPLAARGRLSPVRGEGLGRAADSRPYARTGRPLCLLSCVRATAGTSPFRGGQGRGRDPSSASPPQDDTSFVTALAESAPRHLLLEEKATNGRPRGRRAPL